MHGNTHVAYVGEARAYTGSKAAVESFYDKVLVQDPWSGSSGKKSVGVTFLENGKFANLPPYNGLELASTWALRPAMVKAKKVYLVYVIGSGM